MDATKEIPSLAVIASRYRTVITSVSPPGGHFERILTANPLRFWVGFYSSGGATAVACPIPGPIPAGFTANPFAILPLFYDYGKCPAAVTGEWYVSNAAITTYVIVENIYLE